MSIVMTMLELDKLYEEQQTSDILSGGDTPYDFLLFIKNASSQQLYSLINIHSSEDPALEAHLFITPAGDIINIDEYNDEMLKYFSDTGVGSGYNHNIHTDFVKLLWCNFLKQQGRTLEEIKTIIDADDSGFMLIDCVDCLMHKGWLRYTFDPEDRPFPSLQCSAKVKLRAAQYDVVEKLLTKAETKKSPFYLEFINENNTIAAQKKYYLANFLMPAFAEDVIKAISRFYNTGKLTESRKRKKTK